MALRKPKPKPKPGNPIVITPGDVRKLRRAIVILRSDSSTDQRFETIAEWFDLIARKG